MAKLSDLLIDEVSLVRKGANQHAHVAIAKSADDTPGGTVEEYFDEAGNPVDVNDLQDGQIVFDETGTAFQYDEGADDADVDEDAFEYEDQGELVGKAFGGFGGAVKRTYARAGAPGMGAAMGAKRAGEQALYQGARGATNAGRGARSAAGGLSNGAGKVRTKAGNVANAARGGAGSAQNAVGGFARSRGGAASMGAALGLGGGYAGGRVHKSYQEGMQVELSKALTDDDRDAVISKYAGVMDELADQVSKAQEIAESEREARLDAEFYEVAKSYTLPVDVEDLADAMRAMAEFLSPDQIETVRKCLDVASDAMTAEYGASGGGDNNDIMSQVEAQAARFSKSGESFESLTADVFTQNPAAYEQYLADNPAQYGR